MADRVVRYVLKGDVAGFGASMKAAGASVGKLADDLTKADAKNAQFRAGLSTVGDAAGKVGLVAAAGLGMATKAAMGWQVAWTGVLKTVDGSPAQLAKLEEGLRNLATETGFAHEEVAAVAEAAGQLGISTAGIESFTSTVLDMGVSTSLSSEEAATGLARLRNIMGSTEAEIANTGSTMVALGNSFATTETEILAMSQRLAGAGRQAGLSTAEVLGLSAAMSSVGIEAEAGGTAMSLTMKRIGKEVETSGEKLDLFARVSGMTAEEFSTAWQQDAGTALTAFVTGLGNAESVGMSTNAVLRELGVTGIREADALLRLSGNAEGLAGALDTANTAFAENNALTEESGKFYATSAQQMKQAWAEIKDAAIDVGGAVLPVVSTMAQGVGTLASAFASLPGPVKSATAGLLGVTAVVGGGLWFTAKAIGGVTSMRVALAQLGVTAAGTTSKLGSVAALAGGPWGIGLAAAGAAAYALSTVNDDLTASLESTANALSDGIMPLNEQSDALEEARQSVADYRAALDDVNLWDPAVFKNTIEGVFGKSDIEEAEEALAELEKQFQANRKEAQAATSTNEDYAESTGEVGSTAASAADELGDLIDAMREQRSEALRAANAEINYEAALDDSRKALKENGRTVDISTEKGRANMKALYGQAAAFNDLSAEAKNAPGAHRAAIASFVNMAEKMGMGRQKARELAQSIIEIPDKKVTITADTAPATAALDSFIRSQSGRVISIGTRIVASSAGIPGGMVARAEGGPVYGEGTATSDSIPAWLSNGEFVMKAAAVQKYGLRAMHDLNAMRLAGGGPVGMADGGSVDDRLSILRLQQQINEMRRDLAKDGKDSLKGLARTIAALELKAAQADLRQARRAPLVEARSGLREARAGLRSIEFDVEGGMSLADTREALRQFRTDVREAGGTWTKAMGRTAHRLLDVAKASQRNQNQLEREAEKRDRLGEVLEQEIAALEQLQQTMAAYSASVSSNFLNDPFNGARAVTGGSAAPVDDAALNAARAALSGAESRLAGIRGSDMDPLQRSYLASKAVAEVAEYRSQVEQLDRGREALGAVGDESEQMVSGLEALRETLLADTKAAQEFAASLATLSAAGLSAGLFQQLAASGDTGTAAELAGLGAGGIAELNAMWDQREAAAAQVATFATQQVFGAQLDAATRAVVAAEKAFQQSDREIARLNRITERHAARIENLTERGSDAIVAQVKELGADIRGQARQLQELQRAGKKGRN